MSIEVLAQDYLWRGPRYDPSSNTWTREPSPNQNEFRRNPLHDLESLWWIAVYFLVNRQVIDPIPDVGEAERLRATQQDELFADLFRHFQERQNNLQKDGIFAKGVQCLHPSLKSAALIVDKARKSLSTQYRRKERNINSINRRVAGDLYEEFQVYFKEVAAGFSERDVKVSRFER